MGPWNPDNEDWFVGRFESYLKGTGIPFSINYWRQKMCGFKESEIMMMTLESHCAKFICA